MSDLTIGLELVESRTLRSRHLQRAEVLDKVKGLATLPGNELATVKQVAEFYEVSAQTIGSVVEDNRAELEASGYRTLIGPELNPFKGSSYVGLRARSLAVFGRTAVLNVGMLLTDSDVARQVRAYLLTVEATATTEHRLSSVELVRLQERMDYKNILQALKGADACADDYRTVQNSLYMGLFGKTAAQIRATQTQRTGKPRKDGKGLCKSTVAKDFFSEKQLAQLNSAVLAITAQLQLHYRSGASAAEMITMANRAISLVTAPPRRIGAAS